MRRTVAALALAACTVLGGRQRAAVAADGEPPPVPAGRNPAESTPAQPSQSARWQVESPGPADETAEFLRLLDAAWPQFEAFFGSAPALATGVRLRVRFFETADAMKDAIRKAGGAAPDAGGYYCPVARTSYAFRQPSRWYTRTLLLHEAAHQFHLRGAAAKSRGALMPWWVEGIAEHISHHTWDGTTLRLGVVPLVSLEDRPAPALAAAAAKAWSPEKVADEALDRPQAMHVVRFLATSNGGGPVSAWAALSKRLDAGEVLRSRELAAAAGGRAQLREKYVAWIRTVQQPFVSEFIEWDSTGPDSVRGTGAFIGICRTREPAASIEAEVTPRDPAKGWRAGLLLRWSGGDDYVIAQIEGGAKWFVDERKAGAWKRVASGAMPVDSASAGAVPAGAPRWKLAAAREAGEIVLRISDSEVARLTLAAGPMGLCQEGASSDFTSIRWK